MAPAANAGIGASRRKQNTADLDGIVDLPNDILGVIQHFCPLISMPCAKVD
ncbi:MAG: hypothetical protein IIC91_01530 [Chloroflexi bacterium]|nr:hypothetical protein [Chloroflexota bacterium]